MSKINFPTQPTGGDKFTFSGKTWNFNGLAWDKVSADGDVDSIATGTGGYVAFYTPEGVAGSTIGPAAEVLFWDDTNNRLGIGTTGPSQALEVVGGITASGGVVASGATFGGHVNVAGGLTADTLQVVSGATFGGTVHFDEDTRHNGNILFDGTASRAIKHNGTEVMFISQPNGVIRLPIYSLQTSRELSHIDDSDTFIRFPSNNNLHLSAGNNLFLEGTSTNVTVGGSTFANGLVHAHGITLGLGGITFADGTHQTTAFRAGLKYTVTSIGSFDNPPQGGVVMASNVSGTAIDILSINSVDANGNDIDALLDLYAANGGLIQVLKEDGSELVIVATDASEVAEATVTSDGAGGTKLSVTETSGFEVDTTPSVGDVVYVYIVPNLVSAVQTIGGQQGNIQIEDTFGLSMAAFGGSGYLRVNPHHHFNFQGAEFSQTSNFAQGVTVGTDLKVGGTTTLLGGITLSSSGITFGDGTGMVTAAVSTPDENVAVFNMNSSSGILAGSKEYALHRVPYDAEISKFELFASAVGGFSGAARISGNDFANPTQGAGGITSATISISGALGMTASTSTVDENFIVNSSVTGGNFMYFHVHENAGGCTSAQAFVTYTRR